MQKFAQRVPRRMGGTQPAIAGIEYLACSTLPSLRQLRLSEAHLESKLGYELLCLGNALKLRGVVTVEAADCIIDSAELIECSKSLFFRTINGGLDGFPVRS